MTNAINKFPISVKGVLIIDGKVPLLKNERDEWELPGGKIEIGESPEQCVVREIEEELGISVSADKIVDSWMYHIRESVDVFIVTYGCNLHENEDIYSLVRSSEHRDMKLFSFDEVVDLNMPVGYKNSIFTWRDYSKNASTG